MLTRVARFTATAGAPAALALTVYAGRHNPSRLLIAIFALWAVSPFAAALWTLAKRPSSATAIATLLFTIASLAIYADAAFGHPRAKLGFIFLVVPFASLVVVAIAAIASPTARSAASGARS
jgi:hypothetical protein